MSWLDAMQSFLAPVCKWMCDPSYPATEDQVVQVPVPVVSAVPSMLTGQGPGSKMKGDYLKLPLAARDGSGKRNHRVFEGSALGAPDVDGWMEEDFQKAPRVMMPSTVNDLAILCDELPSYLPPTEALRLRAACRIHAEGEGHGPRDPVASKVLDARWEAFGFGGHPLLLEHLLPEEGPMDQDLPSQPIQPMGMEMPMPSSPPLAFPPPGPPLHPVLTTAPAPVLQRGILIARPEREASERLSPEMRHPHPRWTSQTLPLPPGALPPGPVASPISEASPSDASWASQWFRNLGRRMRA
eukprot:s2727_g2.t1